MIKIENVVLPSLAQWESVIIGMRNPMNSWEKSDTVYEGNYPKIGSNDLSLMERLRAAGHDHSKFMRMIPVYLDVIQPLYWWKEFDTYKVGTVANSCSTMHKIAAKEFTLDDFSHEHLLAREKPLIKYTPGTDVEEPPNAIWLIHRTIQTLNQYRNLYLQTKDKKYWWQLIQLLPSSYNQRRTIFLNYEVLANMYHSRKNHKLDEWRTFCKWIETLPFSELITGGKDGNE